MRYQVVSVFDPNEVGGAIETDDDDVVVSFQPAEGIQADLFKEEIESGESIFRVAGHWRMSAFIDEDGKPVSGTQPVKSGTPVTKSLGWVDDDLPDEVELTGTGVISKTDEARRIIYGWAYVTHDKDGEVVVDKSGDFVDVIDEIDKAAVQFMLDSRSTDAHHTNVKSGTVVESMVFTPEKIEKMGLPPGVLPSGWWIGTKVDEQTWDAYKQGRLTAFSVHGKGLRKAVH